MKQKATGSACESTCEHTRFTFVRTSKWMAGAAVHSRPPLPAESCRSRCVNTTRFEMGKRQRFHRKNCSNGNGHKDKASLQISGQVLLSWRPKPRLSPPIQATAVTSVSCISFFGDSCFHSPLQTDQVRCKGQRSDSEGNRISHTWFLQTFQYRAKNSTIWVPCSPHMGQA